MAEDSPCLISSRFLACDSGVSRLISSRCHAIHHDDQSLQCHAVLNIRGHWVHQQLDGQRGEHCTRHHTGSRGKPRGHNSRQEHRFFGREQQGRCKAGGRHARQGLGPDRRRPCQSSMAASRYAIIKLTSSQCYCYLSQVHFHARRRRRASRPTAAVTSAQKPHEDPWDPTSHGTDPVLISRQSLRNKPCRPIPVRHHSPDTSPHPDRISP